APGQQLSLPSGMAKPWVARRPGPMPQHLAPMTAWIADRLVMRGARPDLWHHTDPSRPLGPLPDDRTIVTVHDLAPLRIPTLMADMRWTRRLAYRRYLRLVSRARLVVCGSTWTADEVTRLVGVRSERIRVFTPWVRAQPPEASADDGRIEPSTLLLVGISGVHKRFDLGVQALAVLRQRGRDIRLEVAGFQAPAEHARLQRLAEDLGVGADVDLIGHVDGGDLAARYARSVTLALSTTEGFGLTPVEAILSGGRVAAVDIPAYQNTVGSVAPIAADDSPEAVADAIEVALASPPEPARVAALAAHFSARACATSLREAYEIALG
ncbi:MAG: glycosyltransferase, partial [Candidatus Limnocylindrales bacterium]